MQRDMPKKKYDNLRKSGGSRRRSRSAKRAVRTRRKEYRQLRSGLLILDFTARKERRSEGKLVFELMRIVDYDEEVKIDGPFEIRRKSDFFDELAETDAYSIHISSHGGYDKNGSYIILPYGGKVYARDLEGLWGDRSKAEIPKLIALSACYAGRGDLIEAFSKAGCRYCIAPSKDPYWHNAALFWVEFYTVLYLRSNARRRRSSPWIAFRNTRRALPEVSRIWSLFDNGAEFVEE